MAGREPAGNSMSTTGPVIWTTLPMPDGVATAMVFDSLTGLGAGGDFDHFSRDVGLANLVVAQGQVVDEVGRVVGRVLHGDHAAGLLARLRLQHRLVEARRDIPGEQPLEHRARIRLEDELV